MAYNKMLREENIDYSDRIDNDAYYYTETKSAGTTGDPVIIPNTVKKILTRLVISSGSGSVETSVSSKALIKAGSGNWKAWTAGTVSTTTDDIGERVNAIRLVRATGTVIMELNTY